ncbi:MAG: ribosomal protein S18-alanine N-acetyltransferase [Candidatus Methanosuratincola sp.]
MEPASRVSIEPMRLEDIDEVVGIEELCFPTPWPRGVFESEVRSARSLNLVARIDGTMCGYIISWKVYDEVHILNVAVHPQFRRMGIGTLLITTCIGYFLKKGAKHALLEVRVSNEAAQRLYEKLGFRRIGVRRRYYTDNNEDAIVMMLTLEPPPAEKHK